MSDLSARKKAPSINIKKTTVKKTSDVTIEPDAESKKLDQTKEKYDAVKKSARISVGTKPLSPSAKSEFSVREGSSLKKLHISEPSTSGSGASKMVASKPAVSTSPISTSIVQKAHEEIALKRPSTQARAQAESNAGTLSARPKNMPASKDIDTSLRVKPAARVEKSSAPEIKAPTRTKFATEPQQKPQQKLKQELKQAPKPQNLERKVAQQATPAKKAKVTPVDVTPDYKVSSKRASYKVNLSPETKGYRLSSVVGASLTAVWFVIATVYAQFYMGLGEALSQQPHVIGGFLAGILAPVALLWMIIAHIQRGDVVRQYALALREELKSLNFGTDFARNKVSASAEKIDITEDSKKAVESIHKARAGLRDEIKYLSDVSERTGSQLDKLNTTLSDRASKLLGMTQDIEKRTASLEAVAISKIADIPSIEMNPKLAEGALSKTDGLAGKMDERIRSLNEVLGKMEGTLGDIESKGTDTADKLSKALSESSSNINTMESSISNSIEKLEKVTDAAKTKANDLVEKSSEKIQELNNTGEKTSQKITSVLDMIDSSREKIEKTSHTMSEQAQKTVLSVEKQASDIDKAQSNIGKRIDEMQLRVSEPLAAVNRAVDKAMDKHEDLGKALDKRIVGLNDASDRAVEKTDAVRTNLREQIKEMSTLMGSIAGHSRSVKSMLRDENENLSESIDKTLAKVDGAGETLRGQADKLNDVTASAEERIQKIGETLASQSVGAVKNTGRVISEFKTVEKLVTDNMKSLMDKTKTAQEAVSSVGADLAKSVDVVGPIYEKATEQIDKTRDRFEKMSSGFETRTNSNVNKLKSFETLFDERVKTLSSSAEDASRILEKASGDLGERVGDIDSATLNAQEKLQDIDGLFKQHVSEIHLTTDQALLKIDDVQTAMNTHYQDLSASVADSLAQMQDVSAQFVKQTEQVEKLSSSAVKGLDKAGGKANEKVKDLNKLAEKTATQMEAMLKKVQSEADQLLKTSAQTLSQMKATGDEFADRAKLVEEQMQSSVKSTKKYGDELDKQAGKVSKMSQRSASDIEKAMGQLAKQLLDVKEVSKEVTGEVVASRDKLSSETEHLADVSLKASRVVEAAATSYVRQSGAMNKATVDAVGHIERARKDGWRAQRDSFLTSTRFVLESLHSLSVDLTRMMDGDIQEKTWKSYQKGDVAAFTRRLIDNKAKLPQAKMEAKYADDNEFRTYVNKFVIQFEDMFEQAGSNDYGELISATFASSDVAQLYDILCDIAGRKSMIKKLNKRAA